MNESASLDTVSDSLNRNADNIYDEGMGYIRDQYAADVAREERAIIAYDLDCRIVKTLSIQDLIHMVRDADTSGIPVNDIRSFHRADLIMETVCRDTGETCYVAVEVSFNASRRDTRRAIRNADFLRRFTGKDALAVVSGVSKDDRVDAEVAANNVAWYQLDEEKLWSE